MRCNIHYIPGYWSTEKSKRKIKAMLRNNLGFVNALQNHQANRGSLYWSFRTYVYKTYKHLFPVQFLFFHVFLQISVSISKQGCFCNRLKKLTFDSGKIFKSSAWSKQISGLSNRLSISQCVSACNTLQVTWPKSVLSQKIFMFQHNIENTLNFDRFTTEGGWICSLINFGVVEHYAFKWWII